MSLYYKMHNLIFNIAGKVHKIILYFTIRSRISRRTMPTISLSNINHLSIFFKRDFVCSKLLLLTNNPPGGQAGGFED